MVIEVPTGAVSPNEFVVHLYIQRISIKRKRERTLRVKESLFYRNKGGTADYDYSSLVVTVVITRDFLRAYAEPWT